MKGKFIKSALLLLALGCLTGCGGKKGTEDIAIIKEASQEGDMLHAVENAAQQYAGDNGLVLNVHDVVNDTPEDYMVAIQEAADAGASVIVGYGEEFEIPLYTMQKKNKKVKFIIIDGAPRKAEGKRAKVRKNTHAVVYNEAQAGFLAGYAAVKDGYRNIGFMGGVKKSNVAYYGSGFVQGAEYAAAELGLAASDVTVRYAYLGTNEISPAVMASANAWYEDGCELIFASGGSIATAVMKSAEQNHTKMIAADVEQVSTKQAVLTSAVKNVNDTVYNLLGSVYGDSFEGKKQEIMDVSNDGVGLSMNQALFVDFTSEDYNSIVTKIIDEEVEVLEEYVSAINDSEEGITHITLEFES